jgi:2-methylcitrate dehydratase PrpD
VDYPLGNAKNRVSDEELVGKFNALVVPKIGDAAAKRIVDLGWKMDQASNVNELMKACVVKG